MLVQSAASAADTAHYLEQTDTQELVNNEPINLLDIPARRWLMGSINEQASLYEAYQSLRQHEALCVVRKKSASTTARATSILGVITPDMLDNYCRL